MAAAANASTLVGSIVLAILVLVVFWIVTRAFLAIRGAGFTPFEALLILVVAPLTAGLNVAVAGSGNLLLAINVAGLLIPLLISLKIVLGGRVPRFRTALGVVVVAAVVYRTSELVPNEGVRLNVVVPVALAAVLGFLLSLGNVGRAPLVAYVSGAMGVLIGADLARLPQILASQPAQPTAASIGGAGTLDAIFLVAILAVLLDLLVFAVFRRPRARSSA